MSALDEYRQLAPAYAEVESPADYVKGLADCAIAELEQSETELQDACDNQFRATVRQRERAEKAEAELAAMKAELAAPAGGWIDQLRTRTEAAEAELAALEQTKIVLICRTCGRHNTINLSKTVDAARSVYEDEEEL